MEIDTLKSMIDAGLGTRPLDLVIRGGKLLDVYRGGWIEGDLGIAAGKIVALGADGLEADEAIDATDKWVVPGFFDPHFHAGGSHLSPTRLAEAFLARGTTSTVCDFQEHYVVAGPEAARFALDEAREAGLRVFYLAPIHMYVVDELGVAGQPMRAEHLLEMLEWPETVAINEPPPAPVLAKRDDTLKVIARTMELGKIYAGHAPGFAGGRLQTYISTGASSDHESTAADEAWEKLAYGMRPIMRHGSAAPDMENLISIAKEHENQTRHMMLGTDEVDPVDLASKGHMDLKVRLAIEWGVDPITALQMVTINPAEYYRVDHLIGSLAPGRNADVVILDDLDAVEVSTVIAGGDVIDRSATNPGPEYPELVKSTVNLPRPMTADDFRVQASGDRAEVRIVGVHEGSLVSTREQADLAVEDGNVLCDPGNDVLKMAVVDRHTGSGDLSVGFVQGFGFQNGAVATTYAHPYYNVLVVGTDEESMAQAANELRDLGGGIVVVKDGEVLDSWHLPIVGIFSTDSLDRVRDRFAAMNEALGELGCPFAAPVLALSFVALPTIPAYGLTSKGLFDVDKDDFVSVMLEEG